MKRREEAGVKRLVGGARSSASCSSPLSGGCSNAIAGAYERHDECAIEKRASAARSLSVGASRSLLRDAKRPQSSACGTAARRSPFMQIVALANTRAFSRVSSIKCATCKSNDLGVFRRDRRLRLVVTRIVVVVLMIEFRGRRVQNKEKHALPPPPTQPTPPPPQSASENMAALVALSSTFAPPPMVVVASVAPTALLYYEPLITRIDAPAGLPPFSRRGTSAVSRCARNARAKVDAARSRLLRNADDPARADEVLLNRLPIYQARRVDCGARLSEQTITAAANF